MKLNKTLCNKNIFTLFTAPVAQGKTKSILDFYHDNQFRVIFISPLRALAVEIYEKLKSERNIFFLGDALDKNVCKAEKYFNFLSKDKAFLITTVEMLDDSFIEMVANEEKPILFVFDEIHLFYIWGDSFRPVLHDKFLAVLNSEHPVIALSATMSEEIMNFLCCDLKYYNDFWIHLNLGNQELFRKPQKIVLFKGHEKKTLERAFAREMKIKNSNEVFLMFCSYRGEVDERVEWARRCGYRAIGCVGGEVEEFQRKLKEANGLVDCIFSTIALSHGVNLPEIKKVFINYEVSDYDFWLQMVGRGGRQGSSYEVYTFDSYFQNKKEKFLNYVSVGVSDWLGIEL